MRKKIQYRAESVERILPERLAGAFEASKRVVVGVDVAKRNFVTALCNATGETVLRVRFEHPRQTAQFVGLLAGLQAAERLVEVAMEPTGTYGDALRYRLGSSKIPVFRVSNKHVHDASELFDSSPSKHDGKDSSVIGWLHAQGRSKRWEELDPARRSVRALVAQRDLYDEPMVRLITHMEPLLARHFPEFETFFDLSQRMTPWVLLEAFGSPAAMGKLSVEEVLAAMKDQIRRRPSAEDLQSLLEAARSTSGAPMVSEETQLVRRMATEVLHLMRKRREVDERIAKATEDVEAVKAIRPCLGPVTAAVIFAYLGDPKSYASAAALEKAAGLNLIESSSGTDPNAEDNVPRHISKRGASIVRKYLFLAAMRLVRSDPIAKAWYQARRSYKAQQRTKAIVAVERKLCRSLFHVAKGQSFDTEKLFDNRRLGVVRPPNEEAA
jgi:transposase